MKVIKLTDVIFALSIKVLVVIILVQSIKTTSGKRKQVGQTVTRYIQRI